MSKTVWVEAEGECDDDHCDEFTAATCPNRAGNKKGSHYGTSPMELELTKIWRRYGPDDERLCPITATSVEPWASLARMVFGTDHPIPEPSLFVRSKAS